MEYSTSRVSKPGGAFSGVGSLAWLSPSIAVAQKFVEIGTLKNLIF